GSILRITAPLRLISYMTTLAQPGGGVSPMCVKPFSSTHLYDAPAVEAPSAAITIQILLMSSSPVTLSALARSIARPVILDPRDLLVPLGAPAQGRQDVGESRNGSNGDGEVPADLLGRRKLALPAFLPIQSN